MMKSIHRRSHWPVMMLLFLFAADAATAVGLPGGSPVEAGYTNTDVILLASYILLALVFSFLCSVAEAVLLGMEIVDEMDRVEDMQALARQQWAKRARALGLEVNAKGQTPAAQRSEVSTHPPDDD